MSNPDTWNPVRPPFFTRPGAAAAPRGVHIARLQLHPSPCPWPSCRIPGKAPFPAAAAAVLLVPGPSPGRV